MEIREFKGKIVLESGLHIGGGNDSMKIGGIDSPVISREVFITKDNRERKLREPYIPGSSLKGKVRSLLEYKFGLIDPNSEGSVVSHETVFGDKKLRNLIIKVFGNGKSDKRDEIGGISISRAIFRDAYITKDVQQKMIDKKIDVFEDKIENVINRVKGTAEHPRHIERVVSGIEFDFSFSIRDFGEDEDKKALETILLGLRLLEKDALGGLGSRGSGNISFELENFPTEKELWNAIK
jgi:CRISPR-associated protein Csm3